MAGLSNLNQAWVAHLSAGSKGGLHGAKSRGVHRFSEEICLLNFHHISNNSGMMKYKIILKYILVLLFH